MKTYTIQIEVGSQPQAGPHVQDTVWQAIAPSETVTDDHPDFGTAQGVADAVAANQNATNADLWRVLVWNGVDADTSTKPAAITYSYD